MYAFSLVGMLVCGIALVVGFLIYVRCQWIFWVYYGKPESSLIFKVLAALFFALLYADFAFHFEEHGSLLFFKTLFPFVVLSLMQFLFCNSRWKEMAKNMPYEWEYHARKALPIVLFSVILIRTAYIFCYEYRTQYRWENAEICTVTSIYAESQSSVYACLDNGLRIKMTFPNFYYPTEQVRVFNCKIVQAPFHGLAAGWQEIVDAYNRQYSQNSKKKSY